MIRVREAKDELERKRHEFRVSTPGPHRRDLARAIRQMERDIAEAEMYLKEARKCQQPAGKKT